MEISELEALRDAGAVRNFTGRFGNRPEGLRGRVIHVGAELDPNIVIVEGVQGQRRNWDRRTMEASAA